MINKQPPRAQIIHADEDELKVWKLPPVEPAKNAASSEETNALGLKKTWRYEPPDEQEIAEPVPLTAEEIEEIRQSAYEEGFNQGKEEGFTAGFEQGKKEGFEQGEKEGHEQGVATGLEEGQEKINTLEQQWSALIEQLNKPLSVVEKNVEQQLFQLVAQLTEAVVHQEMTLNPDILTATISEGIKALPGHEVQTQIFLHPDDIKLVEQAFGEEHIKESGWRFMPSPQFERGSCQIENATSNIDLQVKTRLKEVLEPFLQHAIHQK
jgi:flagellar assembly protein FliH